MKLVTFILLTISLLSTSALTAESSNEASIAMALRHNVVAITAKWETGHTENGFGWVVGTKDDKVYIVTANHIVRGSLPGEVDRAPKITLYSQKRAVNKGIILLEQSDKRLDLAIIEMTLTGYPLWKFFVADEQSAVINSEVTYIGEGNKWTVPSKTEGSVTYVSATHLLVKGLDVDVGTSGAPLIGLKGIMGMFISNKSVIKDKVITNVAQVLPINTIKKKVQQWQYPWMLNAFEASPAISGNWHYLYPGEEPVLGSISPKIDTPEHFVFSAHLPTGDKVATGQALVDGVSFKIDYESILVPSRITGELLVQATKKQKNKDIAIVIDGYINFTDEFNEATTEFMRLVRLEPDGTYHPDAVIYMKNNKNPQEAEEEVSAEVAKIANQLSEAHLKKNSPSSRIERPNVANNMTEINGAITSAVITTMIKQIQVLLTMSGMPNVKVSMAKNCILAKGSVKEQSEMKKIDDFLSMLSARTGTAACNEVSIE